MSYAVRELLDFLDDEDSISIDRLCALRGVTATATSAKLESLARSYRGDHVQFFGQLRKRDLVLLLGTPTPLGASEYVLVSANGYSKEDLLGIAISVFRDENACFAAS